MKNLILLLLASLLLCNCKRPDSPTIKILSYNIRLSTVDDGPNHWQLRKAASVRMIEAEEPAAFGLQEAMPEQIDYLEAQLPAYRRVGIGREVDASGEHCAIFYRHEDFNLLHDETRWLSPTPNHASMGWDAAYLRTATFIQLQDKASGSAFWYINTHLDHLGKEARKSSIALLIQWIQELQRTYPEDPILLGGDMNATLEDPIFEPLLTFMKVAQQTAPLSDDAGTYNGWGNVNPPTPIDHIFYLGVEPVVFDNLKNNYGVPYLSDHYPIAFSWKFKN